MEELKRLIEAIKAQFEAFKQANDERLAQVERKGSADPVLTAKVEKMNDALSQAVAMKERLDKIELRMNRPGIDNPSEADLSPEQAAYRKSFNLFMRKGEGEGELKAMQKAVSVGSEADGGYGLPIVIDREIIKLMTGQSSMRSVARIMPMSTTDYRKLVSLGGAASGWVGETTARTATDTPQLAEVLGVFGEIYANPGVTQRSLDDLFFNVEQWVADEVSEKFIDEEGDAFINGNGTNKPKGFLNYTYVPTGDTLRTFGQLEYYATGIDGDFKTFAPDTGVNPLDDILTLVHKLKAKHRARASFMMNDLTMGLMRLFKDRNGNYQWQPSIQAGISSTLFGYPIVEDDNMPDVDSDAYPIAFGDFQAGYQILDVIGTRILRDPFTNKPYVMFYTTKRTGGMVVNTEAIKVLKTGVN